MTKMAEDQIVGGEPAKRSARMLSVNRRIERTAAAWAWRALLGPAMLLDGVFSTLTLGTLSVRAALEVSRQLAMARLAGTKVRT